MGDTNLPIINENGNVDSTRIFVGNVPFDCNADEFTDVFKNIDGFISAELVTRYQSDKTKGFGFVDFENRVINKIIHGTYELKGRTLRVEEYIDKKLDDEKNDDIDKLFIKDINNLTTLQLENYFSTFGIVTKCKVISGINKFAIIHIKGNNAMAKFLTDMHDIDGVKIHISPYKKIKKSSIHQKEFNMDNKYSDISNNYSNGIRDGKVIGFANGYKRGYTDAIAGKSYALIDCHIAE